VRETRQLRLTDSTSSSRRDRVQGKKEGAGIKSVKREGEKKVKEKGRQDGGRE
jgi:hypothetical protein